MPAQHDLKVPVSLMIFNDGQAFKNMEAICAPNVLDNLIDRREIPVMLSVFINPGRTPEQPEPTPQEWGIAPPTGRRNTTRSTTGYARVIVDELMPALYKELQHLEGSGAPRHRRRELGGDRGVHGRLGAAERLPQGAEHDRQLHQPPRRHAHADIVRKAEKKPDPHLHAGWSQRQSR